MIDYKNDELYSEHGLCTKSKCGDCVYCGKPSNTSDMTCDYILLTEHRRPCPAGTNCTVYVKKDKSVKKKMGKLV